MKRFHFKPKSYLYIVFITILYVINASADFSDITEQTRIKSAEVSNGVAFIDFDNDGYLDLYISSDPDDMLYRNNGDGTFTDFTIDSKIKVIGDGVGIAFGDYDNDGDLDIYIPVNDGADIFFQNENGISFRNITREARIENFGRARSAVFVDFDLDGLLDIFIVNEGSPNILYKNRNGRFFEDVTIQMGLSDSGPGRCSIWSDIDNDGDPDLYITNKGIPNKFYRNDRGSFKDITNISGVGEPLESTGSAFGDYNNDGFLDIFVGDNGKFYLYHNNGNGTFTNVADKAGIINSGKTCTPTLADFDNDGNLDLYLSVWGGKSLLYLNNGDGTFRDMTDQYGLGAFGNAWSATAGDFDNDGDIDIYASFTTRDNILYSNNGNSNNWLHVKTVGSISNKGGIGVRIKATTDESIQIREIYGGTGYSSQDSLIAEFGFGEISILKQLDIYWTSGIHTKMKNVSLNQMIVVEEGFSAVAENSLLDNETTNDKDQIAIDEKNAALLLQNYPNPFNPETWIPFRIAQSGYVSIIITDIYGKIIKVIELGYRNAGTYIDKTNCAFWDGKNDYGEKVSSGIYFYQLKCGHKTDIKKMILCK